jgi:zinc transporter ZupT
MILNVTVLLISTLLAGLAVLLIPKLNISKFKLLLSFSGAYLFSITVIHILPEIFHESTNLRLSGIYVLAGFFLQMILEYFSSGVEHGHMHTSHDHGHHHHHAHSHLPYSMFISLCIHSFLEGTLLMHPFHNHAHEGAQTLLIGLVLHKIPESFALISILIYGLKNRFIAIALLIVYSLCSPVGLFASDFLFHEFNFDESIFQFLFAIVAGNFLYISTTIFFETSPDHKFKINRLATLILAACMAILAEVLMG